MVVVISEGEEISTHALTEGDHSWSYLIPRPTRFQLTPSRRATVMPVHSIPGLKISTHALTEGDSDRIRI